MKSVVHRLTPPLVGHTVVITDVMGKQHAARATETCDSALQTAS